MSAAVLVTFPGAPNMWEEWANVDFSFPTLDKSESKDIVVVGGMMDIEEVTVVVKRPRRIRRTPTKSPVRKRVHRSVEIKTENVKTLAEYQAEKQKHIDAMIQEQTQKEQTKKEETQKEQTKKEKKPKKTKKNDGWTTIKKEEKAVSLIRGPDRQYPVQNVKSNGTTLILKNLPKHKNVSVKEIRKFFGKCGLVKFVNVLTHDDGTCKGTAFVKFENKAGSDKGLTMNEFWYENNKIYVEYTRN